MPAQKEWKRKADALFLMQKRKLFAGDKITGPFEANITIDPAFRLELDNSVKPFARYRSQLRHRSRRQPQISSKADCAVREAPEGARLTLTQISSCAI